VTTLLVLGDSLAFHGPDRPEPASEPRLWPNVAAARLGGNAELFAGSGWTARDAWWSLCGDPRLWATIPTLDAVVLGVASMDSMPSPLPTYLRTGLRHLRPAPLRRAVRRVYQAAQPGLARLLATATGGRPTALPPHLTVAYLERCRRAVAVLRPGLPVVAVLPAGHRAARYGHAHPRRESTAGAVRCWAAAHDVPLVDLYALTMPFLRVGDGNPDGMHWGWAAHESVGVAVADAVARAVRGASPRGVPAPGAAAS
jgi:diglucosylglycerate octanoyltransferase